MNIYPNDIKGVVFDMDGVLIDAREWHYEALNEALEPFGFEIGIEEHNLKFDGLPTSKKLEILSLEKKLPKKLYPIISAIKQDRTLRIAASKCYPNISHLILIQKLKILGLQIGVYTNSIRRTTEFMLTYANLIDFIDFIVTNEDVSNPKPSPEGYLKISNLMELAPNNVLVIEDGEYGLKAALEAGCQTIKVNKPNDVNINLFSKLIPTLMENK